ncbi:hypothetical protein WA158_008169 [Blastocystis sp. Blastoise]
MFSVLSRVTPRLMAVRNIPALASSYRFMSSEADKVIYIEQNKEYDDLIAGKNPSIMYFFATWCGPCKRMAPYFSALSNQNENINFVKIDVDKVPDVATLENVVSVPTFKLYSDKQLVAQFAGASKENLKSMVDYCNKKQ